MSNGRALDNNKAIFGKQQTIAAVEHADKTTTASKKRKLPEVAVTDDEKDDFELGTHNFLKNIHSRLPMIAWRITRCFFKCGT